ncbi:leucine-rich repeat domain-containing protein [Allomuricauda sp. SCSIO 65647]|uniref:leucine-rich repeat domain-containing protein n=1 Tax=Allomuricauda sp. SCSIO 65647 TaxID=2908843 RepID=UPI001F2CFB89|nr:hypothetical protein [Muricauda sp. SCSIO 65647]UJH67359.1 hypothetical protein L0P89_15590 [Muricauda sp. SCSIO 65647]
MSFRIKSLGPCVISFLFLVTLLSCEEEGTAEQNLQKIALKIETSNGSSGVADLVVTNQNGSAVYTNSIPVDTVEEIELDIKVDATYVLEVDDSTFGRIKMYATGEALQTHTLESPFILQFGHYKNQQVATFQVRSDNQPPSQLRFIDLALLQSNEASLYHIDWGDGSEYVAQSPNEIRSQSDRIEHRYSASGNYTITISTTSLEEVEGIELQVTGNGIGDHIQTLQLEDLPNLNYLNLGDNDLTNIDSIIANYPNLNHLSIRFGNLTAIDLSQNSLLEILIVSDNFDTEIKGLSTLTHLKFLGLTGIVEDLNLSIFTELSHLSLKGHKTSTLDVTQNTKLTSLLLQLNDLEEIHLDSNVNLETLYITNNKLTQLDLSNNPEIKTLNLYANYIEELDLGQQDKLEYLNLSSVHLKQVTAPESLDNITFIDLSDSRFLDEAALLDAVFKGQENNLKKDGQIIFNELAVILDRQIELLQEMVDDHNWNINIP